MTLADFATLVLAVMAIAGAALWCVEVSRRERLADELTASEARVRAWKAQFCETRDALNAIRRGRSRVSYKAEGAATWAFVDEMVGTATVEEPKP